MNMGKKTIEIPVIFKPQVGLGGGFRQEWVTAAWEKNKAGIDAGAGFGNPMMTFWIEQGRANRVYFETNVADLLRLLIAKAGRK